MEKFQHPRALLDLETRPGWSWRPLRQPRGEPGGSGGTARTIVLLGGVRRKKVFAQADYVTLHCPLTSDNAGMVDRQLLQRMKPSAVFINTARGGLVHEQDLADALNQGVISGAAVDVLSAEPPPGDSPLLHAKNCLITPHIAWATLEARRRLMTVTVENIRAFLNGKPGNVVNAS